MSVAIRYQSRGGHVKEMAEIISEGAGVEPISIDDPRAPITEPVDILFIGGALYKFKLDPGMEDYLASIPEGMVRKAIVFGSSALTRRPIYLIQERLKAKGIDIHPMGLYMRGKPKPYLREIGVPWAAREIAKIEKEIADGTYGQPEEPPIVQMINNARQKREMADTMAKAEAAEVAKDLEEKRADMVEHASEVKAKVESAVDELAAKDEQVIEDRRREVDARREELERKKAELERELAELAELDETTATEVASVISAVDDEVQAVDEDATESVAEDTKAPAAEEAVEEQADEKDAEA